MTDPTEVILELALEEDIGSGDVTSAALFKTPLKGEAVIMAKEDLVVAGLDIARKTFLTLDPKISFEPRFAEGASVKKGEVIVRVKGEISSLMKGERVALNFLQHLSGIATFTRHFVKKVKKYKVEILDTRKTTPGLRSLEKKAVRLGGGSNHRMGLYDQFLIKENHIQGCGSLEEAIRRASAARRDASRIEVEIERLDQIPAAVSAGTDILLFDNLSPREVKKGVRLVKKLSRNRLSVQTEVSGGINLKNVVKYARAGVDRISIGALTHSSPAADISMRISSSSSARSLRLTTGS